jgi:hypothetical protein
MVCREIGCREQFDQTVIGIMQCVRRAYRTSDLIRDLPRA